MFIEKIQVQEGMTQALMTAYIQEYNPSRQPPKARPAVLICPGGAFIGISADEGEPVALKFAAEGYHAFVLEYSIGVGAAALPAPLLDVARALHHIRQNARRWALDSDQITLCGFSTGGYLAAAFSARWHEGWMSEAVGVSNQWFKPNRLILGYPILDLNRFQRRNHHPDSVMNPVIEMMNTAIFNSPFPAQEQIEAWHFWTHISSDMPPTFLWTLRKDVYVEAAEPLEFAAMLAHQDIAYELHVFRDGSHGMSLGDETVGYDQPAVRQHANAIGWFDMAIQWLHVFERLNHHEITCIDSGNQ